MYAVHFGIYPTTNEPDEPVGVWTSGSDPGARGVAAAQHTDPNVEYTIEVPEGVQATGCKEAYVSGSWGCWGPADQATDGDESLHLVFYTERIDIKMLNALHMMAVTMADGRVLDHAVISPREDWSEHTHVVLYGGHPWVVVVEGRVVDAGGQRLLDDDGDLLADAGNYMD